MKSLKKEERFRKGQIISKCRKPSHIADAVNLKPNFQKLSLFDGLDSFQMLSFLSFSLMRLNTPLRADDGMSMHVIFRVGLHDAGW